MMRFLLSGWRPVPEYQKPSFVFVGPRTMVLLGVLAACVASSGCGHDGAIANEQPLPMSPPDTVMLALVPDRDGDALSGSAFLAATADTSYAGRQARAVDELLGGNLPASLRTLTPLVLARGSDSLLVWVTRDYLSIGSDTDFVRMPLSLPSAQAVAQDVGMVLPTPRLVDAIYAQADLQLAPQPMAPGPAMRSNAYYGQHQRMIEEQRAGRAPEGLIAGHKKDVVVTGRMRDQPDRVPIYGWHKGVAAPIQPLSLVHDDDYEDYSHGLRLVHPIAHLHGTPVDLSTLVRGSTWRSLLSNETEGLDLEALSWGN